MTDSSSDLKALLAAERLISAPTAADRRRNRRGLARRIGLGALASAGVAATSSWGARIAWASVMKWMPAVVLVGASGATAAWLAVGASRATPSASPVSLAASKVPTTLALPSAATPDAEPPLEAPVTPVTPVTADVATTVLKPAAKLPALRASPARSTALATPATVVPDQLEAEASLLSQARGAMRGGDPEKALSLLDSGQTQFRAGALREESAAARVFALCQLGRAAEARLAAANFARNFPASPLRARVRDACQAER